MKNNKWLFVSNNETLEQLENPKLNPEYTDRDNPRLASEANTIIQTNINAKTLNDRNVKKAAWMIQQLLKNSWYNFRSDWVTKNDEFVDENRWPWSIKSLKLYYKDKLGNANFNSAFPDSSFFNTFTSANPIIDQWSEVRYDTALTRVDTLPVKWNQLEVRNVKDKLEGIVIEWAISKPENNLSYVDQSYLKSKLWGSNILKDWFLSVSDIEKKWNSYSITCWEWTNSISFSISTSELFHLTDLTDINSMKISQWNLLRVLEQALLNQELEWVKNQCGSYLTEANKIVKSKKSITEKVNQLQPYYDQLQSQQFNVYTDFSNQAETNSIYVMKKREISTELYNTVQKIWKIIEWQKEYAENETQYNKSFDERSNQLRVDTQIDQLKVAWEKYKKTEKTSDLKLYTQIKESLEAAFGGGERELFTNTIGNNLLQYAQKIWKKVVTSKDGWNRILDNSRKDYWTYQKDELNSVIYALNITDRVS